MSPWGIRRLLLNTLLHLPVPKPINVAFLDFCLNGMLSPAETVAGQAVCMKLAYAICLKEPELMGELEAYWRIWNRNTIPQPYNVHATTF